MIDGINGRFPVLVTGSRNWTDRPFIWNMLAMLLSTHGDLIVFHGACTRGADDHANEWVKAAKRQSASDAMRFHADWNTLGRRAGHVRNARMVHGFKQAGGKVALAFRVGGEESRGTTGCIKMLRRQGIEPTIFDFETIYDIGTSDAVQ